MAFEIWQAAEINPSRAAGKGWPEAEAAAIRVACACLSTKSKPT
jgi:hypothetical protein